MIEFTFRVTLKYAEAQAFIDESLDRAHSRVGENVKVGDPRCADCDNGLERTWLYCPYCGCQRAHSRVGENVKEILEADPYFRKVVVEVEPT